MYHMKISPIELRHLVEEPYLSRGEEYYDQGLADVVSRTTDSAKIRVSGSRLYTVNLSRKHGQLCAKCTCPAYTDFGPCKHIAASVFALINESTYEPNQDLAETQETIGNISTLLIKKKRSELIDIIIELVGYDNELIDILHELVQVDQL